MGLHFVVDMFVFTKALVIHARTAFKPRCCLHFLRMYMQAEHTDIEHNMLEHDEDTMLMIAAQYSLAKQHSLLEKGMANQE